MRWIAFHRTEARNPLRKDAVALRLIGADYAWPMEEFEFLFDIALAPEFKAEVAADDKVDYYTIDVTEEMVDNQVKACLLYTSRCL